MSNDPTALMPAMRINDMARYILAAMTNKGFETPRALATTFIANPGAPRMTQVEAVMYDATIAAFSAAECVEAARRGEFGTALARAEDAVVDASDIISRIARLDASPAAVARTDARLLGLKLGLVLTELQEAFDAAFQGDVDGVEEELADVIIRVLHIAAGLDMDMDKAIVTKMQVNAGRPYRHGKATGA